VTQETEIPKVFTQKPAHGRLLIAELPTEDSVVFQDEDRFQPVAIRSFNNFEVAKKISVNAARGKSVCRLWHGRIRDIDLWTVDIDADACEFPPESTNAIYSVRQMNDCQTIKIFQKSCHAFPCFPMALRGLQLALLHGEFLL
jgi:hypothetical protein